jgi:hypothetical protein
MACETGTYPMADGGCYSNTTGQYVGKDWSAGPSPTNPPGNNDKKDDKAPKKTAFDWAEMAGKFLPSIFTGVAVLTGKANADQLKQQQQQNSGSGTGGYGYNPNAKDTTKTPPSELSMTAKIGIGAGITAFIGLIIWLALRNKKAAAA